MLDRLIGLPGEVISAILDLPNAVEQNIRTMRKTNDLLQRSVEQLEVISKQVDLVVKQVELMQKMVEKMMAASDPIVEGGAAIAREQMALTQKAIDKLNEQTAAIIDLSEPLAQVAKQRERLGKLFRRGDEDPPPD